MAKKNHIDFIDEQQEKKELKKNSLRDIISGRVLTSNTIAGQLPFIMFIAGLAILYIGNRYHAEKLVRETITLENEVKELRAEAISSAAELTDSSKRSVVLKLIERKGLDLHESLVPPRKIKSSNNKQP